MKKNISHFIALLFMTQTAFGQIYSFKVLINHGQNKIKKASGELTTLERGASLYDDDEIVSCDTAYIALIHRSGGTYEITGSNVVKVKDLHSLFDEATTLPTSSYALSLLDYLGQSDSIMEHLVRSQSIGFTEPVNRWLRSEQHCWRGYDFRFVVPPYDHRYVYGDMVTIRWAPCSLEPESYNIQVKSIFEDLHDTMTISQPYVKISINDLPDDHDLYIVDCATSRDLSRDGAGEEVGFKKLKWDRREDVEAELETLLAELNEDSYLDQLILASFFEERDLLFDSQRIYEEIMDKAPAVLGFRELYFTFLVVNEF